MGRFDGTAFRNDNPPVVSLWSDYGKDCYCALTFNHLPASVPPVMLGWMSNWQYAGKAPTSPWRGQMTIPRAVGLRSGPEGLRLVQQPVAALSSLREKPLSSGKEIALTGRSSVVHASLDAAGAAGAAGWKISGANGAYTEIGYDATRRVVYVDRRHAGDVSFSKDFPARTAAPPLALSAGIVDVDILVDRNSVEVFAGGECVALTNLVFSPDTERLVFFSEGSGAPKFRSADA